MKKDHLRDYYPIDRADKPNVTFGATKKCKPGPARCPADPPRRYTWFFVLLGLALLVLIITIMYALGWLA